jgi:uncharacterized protein YdiU (UPF0061 family)
VKIAFANTYTTLPAQMFTRVAPTPVAQPALFARNDRLAAHLGIDLHHPDAAAVFAGNQVPDGADPIATAYAGHQFGQWNPALGDGRAILLGEVAGFDLQLKGAGRTPYSRNGDGRAWLGPVMREFLVSEAMAALGIPTTRALAAVTTGQDVWRETALPGAILTRVASSHIRVGTFQFFAARQDHAALKALCDHAIARHYPAATGPQDLLDAVIRAQARLVAGWMGLGFIHGVMNTDNAAISGETIDYGPCAFVDDFHPAKVFSAIDVQGRYAYGNQPQIAAWNMAQLATALVPLMPDRDAAIRQFTDSVHAFAPVYAAEWLRVFGAKLGLAAPGAEDAALVSDLLDLMAQEGADFTLTFAALTQGDLPFAAAADWLQRWQARQPDMALMAASNPVIIPRNHQIEAAIAAGVTGDFAPFHALLAAVTDPFAPATGDRAAYALPPAKGQEVRQTFCGT